MASKDDRDRSKDRAFLCDKCGKPVPMWNNAVALEMIRTSRNEPMTWSRHLLPVMEGEQQVCEGSPSSAQYLPGQPRDKRRQFAYNERAEPLVRAAYSELLQKFPPDPKKLRIVSVTDSTPVAAAAA